MQKTFVNNLNDLLRQVQAISSSEWIVPAIGLMAAVLILLIGRRLIRSRHQRSRHPFCASHPHLDPFHRCVSERRSCSRMNSEAVQVLLAPGAARTPVASGWVRDCSLDGMALSVPQWVPPGTILKVRRRDAKGRAAWIHLQVKHSRQEKGTWVLGGQFHASPSFSALLFNKVA